MRIQVADPRFRQQLRPGYRKLAAYLLLRDLPAQPRFLPDQRVKEAVREKMNVRVVDLQRSPRRFAHDPAVGIFHDCRPTWVRPFDNASCVSPATLLTCNFRIMVLR